MEGWCRRQGGLHGRGGISTGSQGQKSFPSCRRLWEQHADSLEVWAWGQVPEGEQEMR